MTNFDAMCAASLSIIIAGIRASKSNKRSRGIDVRESNPLAEYNAAVEAVRWTKKHDRANYAAAKEELDALKARL